MSDSILNIGISGLNAAQWGLTVTGQNISNAATPGYTVEKPEYAEAGGQYYGSGYSGQGVTTTTITRSYSDYLNKQMNSATATSNALTTYYSMMSQMNNLVGSPTSGISTGITGFFSGLQSVANDPSTTSTRQTAVNSAQSLADQINTASDTYDQLRQSVNTQLTSSVSQINTYTSQIATLNNQIAVASAQGQPPNQLLDARDLAVTNLSALVGVQVTTTNNQYNVTFGTGQPLVVGGSSYQLQTATSTSDPSELSVAYSPRDGSVPTAATTQYIQDSAFTSGSVGGLLQFRSQSLDPAQAQLGAIAVSFAAQVNAQNAQGTDATGNRGGALFSVAAPTVYSNSRNTGNASVSVAFTDPTQPTTSDYTLGFNGTTYSLTNKTSGTSLGTFASAAAAGASVGLTITNTGTMNAGDSFTIEPTRGALSSFALTNSDPSAIAAATPATTGVATTGNAGTGAIASSLNATGTVPASVKFSFTSGTSFTANAAVTLADGSVVAAGTAIPYSASTGISVSVNGLKTTLSGAPSSGDSFTATLAASGAADGTNALAMSKLVSTKTMNGGSDTLVSAYANFVNNVGNTTNQLKTSSTAQASVLTQVTSAQQSVSGVNLNEEAANLIQYQQLYQANSKVIQTASTLFQTLLGIFN
jgi:flagellar hook-associated protein 1